MRCRAKTAIPDEDGGWFGYTISESSYDLIDLARVSITIEIDGRSVPVIVEVPTLNGPAVKLKLPPGSANGLTMRARGKGATRKDGTRGDLLVTVEVTVPKHVTGDALSALEQYREATASDDPRAALFKAAEGA